MTVTSKVRGTLTGHGIDVSSLHFLYLLKFFLSNAVNASKSAEYAVSIEVCIVHGTQMFLGRSCPYTAAGTGQHCIRYVHSLSYVGHASCVQEVSDDIRAQHGP